MRKSKQERKDEVFKAIGQVVSQKGFNNVTTKAVAYSWCSATCNLQVF